MELLLSNHNQNCQQRDKNGQCELLHAAGITGAREGRYQGTKTPTSYDALTPTIIRDTSKCILCGRCVARCQNAHGMKNAKILLDQIRDGSSKYHFIEIMGCPGSCIAGGGQPRIRPCFLPNEDDDILDTFREKRAKALYSEDERLVLRQSHNNPQIKKLYEEFLGSPNSHRSHELLHTTYQARVGFND